MKPKISVLMPVYNAEKFLQEAIDSILNQTFTDFEFIIVNDASTDDSKNIILSYKDPRIVYLENARNLGQAVTMNKGLKLAKAEIIARMDADDISAPNRFELQYKEMQKEKGIAVIASVYEVVNENKLFLYLEDYAKSPEEIYYTLQFRDCIGHSTTMFRKSIVLNVYDGYDKNRESEDYDLWLKIAAQYKISKVNTCLLKLRTSKNSRMGASAQKLINDAVFLAQRNVELKTGEKINLHIIEILRGTFVTFRSSSAIKYSQKEIREAIPILLKLNNETIAYHPAFLDKSILEKISIKKLDSLKYDLRLSGLCASRYGFVLKFLFRIYYVFKKRCMLKLGQLGNYIGIDFL